MRAPVEASQQHTLFMWLDRAFRAVWLAFPVNVWITVREILGQADLLGELAPDQAACVAAIPFVQNLSPAGKRAFWAYFTLSFAFYAALLAMAHGVVRSCARGVLFVTPLIRLLGWIALVVTLFPVADLLLSNFVQALLFGTGDLPVFLPDPAFDVTVLGVGLRLLTIALAMRQAMQLHRDAELTI